MGFLFKVRPLIMKCRLGCGACCIAPSISSAIPGMPQGKKAGERCIQLNKDNLCLLFDKKERPAVCLNFKAEPEICANTRQDALQRLTEWEIITKID